MGILIMGWRDASKYVPDKLTYAIRLIGTRGGKECDYFGPLQGSSNYKKIMKYVFDDIPPRMEDDMGGIRFNSDIAKKIIDDFGNLWNGCEDLLVHCTFGRNRSPAVAMALNDLFGLGGDTGELKEKFPEYRRYVYELMMEVSRENSI